MEPPRFTDKQNYPSPPAAEHKAFFHKPPPSKVMPQQLNDWNDTDLSNSSQATHRHPHNQPPTYGNSGPYYDPTQFMMTDPVVNIAKAYGGRFAEQSKQQIEKYVSRSRLKHYFDVDNAYVGKKLGLLFFPFAHKEWSLRYGHNNQPLSPRHDVNSPDLYIPAMSIVTFIVIAGVVLGHLNRFSPEQLGVYATSVMMWLLIENVTVIVVKYILNISQSMLIWDTLSFSGYKYTCMCACLLASLLGGKSCYYGVLTYCSISIVFFLIRSVKGFVLENLSGSDGRKRKLYLLLFIALSQPFIIWWLTNSLTTFNNNRLPVDFDLPEDFEAH